MNRIHIPLKALALCGSLAFGDNWNTATGGVIASGSGTKIGISISSPNGIFDVRPSAASSGFGLPIILSAQQGAASNLGGNVLINAGANGTGSSNGSILLGTGGAIASNGTFTSGERMRIDPAGKVGIGVSANISAGLHIRRDEGIASGEKNWFSIERNGANNATDPSFGIGYRADGVNPSRVWIGAGNSFPLDFRTSSTAQAMTILNNGNVGIGNANPGNKLHVAGSSKIDGIIDVQGGVAASGPGSPIILSAQTGSASNVGGNVLINSGSNGSGSSNGSIILGTGGVIAANGTFSVGERMRIDPVGRVGIGISNPNSALFLRRDEGVGSGEKSWLSIERNGANNTTDPSFGIGYRADGINPSRVWIGSGNGFPLDFRTSGVAQAMTILNNGNVGIGNSNPGKKLEVDGPGLFKGALLVEGNGVAVGSSYGGSYNDFWCVFMDGSTSDQGVLHIRSGDNANEPIQFEQWQPSDPSPHVRMKIDENGRVGIGTETPNHQLDVNGNANVSGNLTVTSVTTKSWSIKPDYVFEKDYKLRPLSEVDAFVKQKKHLPEIPTAREMNEKGIDLADMNMKLLKKVEELTLYSIQQNQTLAKQSEALESQGTRLAKLEAELGKLRRNR